MNAIQRIAIGLFYIFVISAPLAAQSDKKKDITRDQAMVMLNAMGGADAWKQVRTVHSIAVNHHPDARLPYVQEYWYDTQEPKHFTMLTNYDLKRKRGYDVNGGWSVTEGTTKPFDEQRLKRELNSWRRSLYRKIYLLASDPASLQIDHGVEGRLEFSHAGSFIGWVKLNADGEPIRHGGNESSTDYTDFDELERFGPIFWPKSGRDPQGWDFEILSVGVSGQEMPVDPKSLAEISVQP